MIIALAYGGEGVYICIHKHIYMHIEKEEGKEKEQEKEKVVKCYCLENVTTKIIDSSRVLELHHSFHFVFPNHFS